jgi:hypothetical protein
VIPNYQDRCHTPILVEAGMDAAIARERGEDGVIAIQDALILF